MRSPGFKFATVGVVYAVLLGFAVIVVWGRFHDAETAVMQEAGAATGLHRLSDGLSADTAPKMRAGLTRYLHAVIAEDWPAMERRAHGSSAVTKVLTKLYDGALLEKRGDSPGPDVGEVLAQLDAMTAVRRNRLELAAGAVPGVIWMVLFLGGVVTVGAFFLASRNLRAPILMVGTPSALIVVALEVMILIGPPWLFVKLISLPW